MWKSRDNVTFTCSFSVNISPDCVPSSLSSELCHILGTRLKAKIPRDTANHRPRLTMWGCAQKQSLHMNVTEKCHIVVNLLHQKRTWELNCNGRIHYVSVDPPHCFRQVCVQVHILIHSPEQMLSFHTALLSMECTLGWEFGCSVRSQETLPGLFSPRFSAQWLCMQNSHLISRGCNM